jgi:hypothetical protein
MIESITAYSIDGFFGADSTLQTVFLPEDKEITATIALSEIAPIAMRAYIDSYTVRELGSGRDVVYQVRKNHIHISRGRSIVFVLDKDRSDEFPVAAAVAHIFIHEQSLTKLLLGGFADLVADRLTGRLGR